MGDEVHRHRPLKERQGYTVWFLLMLTAAILSAILGAPTLVSSAFGALTVGCLWRAATARS